jgi:hypothetical protein
MYVVIPFVLALAFTATACFEGGEKDPPADDTSGPPDAVDQDGDGYAVDEDCDDADADINPGAVEVCDGVDNDCDGLVDDDDSDVEGTSWLFEDQDTDGYGDPSSGADRCPATGLVEDDTDCDDDDHWVHPGATEVCDLDDADNDCDGLADEEDDSVQGLETLYTDADGDGYGDPATAVEQCPEGSELVEQAGDCDDGDAAISPAAQEVCDDLDVDEDCDGLADDADDSSTGQSLTAWPDDDGDGFGEEGADLLVCDASDALAEQGGDCDDSDALVNPDATEICGNGVDEDCDGDTVCAVAWDEYDAVFNGCYRDDYLGERVAFVGDNDGDGDPEVAVTLRGYDEYSIGGMVQLWDLGLRGDYTCFDAQVDIQGGSANHLGHDLASGDIDGDGFYDLIITDHSGGSGYGYLYRLLGPFTFDGEFGMWSYGQLYGGSREYLGTRVDVAGDLDGDGTQEVLATTDEGVSKVYILAGDESHNGAISWLAPATIQGRSVELGYQAATGVGDINGDGLADVAIGGTNGTTGEVYLFEGAIRGTNYESTADHLMLGTADEPLHTGYMDSAGDIDGDGYDDLLIGSPGYDSASHTDAGRVFLMTGLGAGTADLEADAFLIIQGSADDMVLGGEQSFAAGDIDGDGALDIAIGSWSTDGATFLFYDPAGGTLTTADAQYEIDGQAYGTARYGAAVIFAPDTDGDGTDELIVGASEDSSAYAPATGGAFLYLGANL